MLKKGVLITVLLVAIAATAALLVPPVEQTDAQMIPPPGQGYYSYAVKFVCGLNRTNVGNGILQETGDYYTGGQAPVKLGNYATEINIFNPNIEPADVNKKVLLLVNGSDVTGREPKIVEPTAFDQIKLPFCSATLDDCNRIWELLNPGAVPPTPLPLMIGYLVLESPWELDVNAVYTTEICADWVQGGGGGDYMCVQDEATWGAGISIDVENVEGKFLFF